MAEQKFVKGINATEPREGAPDFVILNLGFKRKELCDWLLAQEGEWVNAVVKRSKSTGKLYVAVDDWKKPEGGGESKPKPKEKSPQQEDPFVDDDLPF